MNPTDIASSFGDALYIMLAALGFFIVVFLVYLWRIGWGRRDAVPSTFTLKNISAYEAVREGLSVSAETGRALHISPGSGGVRAGGTGTSATLAGMSLVESMARVSAITGAPVQATTNDAVAYALTENALRRGYQHAGWSMESESGGARFLTHEDPLAYAAGAAEVVAQQKTSQAVISGQFGPEVLLLLEAQRRTGAQQIAGSSDPQGAALIYLMADHPLIGEEIFAAGAYLERRKSVIASLLAQDWLRWVVIAFIVGGFLAANVLGSDPWSWLSLYP